MAELKALLTALIRGSGNIAEVYAVLDRFLAASPQRAGDVGRLLLAAKKAGLANDIYSGLNQRLQTISAAPGSDENEKTVILSPQELPGGAGDARAVPNPSVASAADSDGTELAGPIEAVDADRTVSDHDDVTKADPPERDAKVTTGDAAAVDEDATAINVGEVDEDATAISVARSTRTQTLLMSPRWTRTQPPSMSWPRTQPLSTLAPMRLPRSLVKQARVGQPRWAAPAR